MKAFRPTVRTQGDRNGGHCFVPEDELPASSSYPCITGAERVSE